MPKQISHSSGEVNLLLEKWFTELNIPFEREYRFAPPRKWRFDYLLWTGTAVEIEGGAWINGRHNRALGFQNDIEKYNHAILLGFQIIRFTPDMVFDGRAYDFLLKYAGLRQDSVELARAMFPGEQSDGRCN